MLPLLDRFFPSSLKLRVEKRPFPAPKAVILDVDFTGHYILYINSTDITERTSTRMKQYKKRASRSKSETDPLLEPPPKTAPHPSQPELYSSNSSARPKFLA